MNKESFIKIIEDISKKINYEENLYKAKIIKNKNVDGIAFQWNDNEDLCTNFNGIDIKMYYDFNGICNFGSITLEETQYLILKNDILFFDADNNTYDTNNINIKFVERIEIR